MNKIIYPWSFIIIDNRKHILLLSIFIINNKIGIITDYKKIYKVIKGILLSIQLSILWISYHPWILYIFVLNV
jgi:hypothetical protein